MFFFGSDQDELPQPAHFTVLEITSRNQGSQLSSATMTQHRARVYGLACGIYIYSLGESLHCARTEHPKMPYSQCIKTYYQTTMMPKVPQNMGFYYG